MPYGRCIKAWARERSIALIPPHGTAKPGKSGQVRASPGKTGLAGRSIELHRDSKAEKVAFFKTFSKKHKR